MAQNVPKMCREFCFYYMPSKQAVEMQRPMKDIELLLYMTADMKVAIHASRK